MKNEFYNDASLKFYYSDKLRIGWFRLKFWKIHTNDRGWLFGYWNIFYPSDEFGYIHVKGVCILGLLIQWRIK